jgi:rod shape determining protein RodA
MRDSIVSSDFLVPGLLLLLGLLGVVLIHSATLPALEGAEGGFHGPGARQLVFLGIAVVAFLIAAAVDYHIWAEFSWLVYAAALLSLGLVLAVGHEANSVRGWFSLGPILIQPAETAKVATLLFAAAYVASRGSVQRWGPLLGLLLIVALPVGLIVLQPDMGTALTFVPLFAVLAFAGGIRMRVVVALVVVALLAVPVLWTSVLRDYQKERILTTLDPTRDPKDSGWQVMQSRIAVGSGEILGKGPGAMTQGRLKFLPEAHTDFVFAVLAEQTGFLGVVFALLLFFLLIWRTLESAHLARDPLGMYICLGVAAIWSFQIFVNAGMVTGMIPTIGIPFPLLSYGGSSLVTTAFAFGLVVNVRMRRFVN